MAEEETVYDKDLEKRILKIVEKVRGNRNRPSYQSIHTHLVRGGRTIEMVDLKVFISRLVEQGLLNNTGSGDKESFKLVCPSTGETVGEDQDKNMEILLTEESMSTNENSSHNEHIDPTFYEILITRIKREVANCVDEILTTYDIPIKTDISHIETNTVKITRN